MASQAVSSAETKKNENDVDLKAEKEIDEWVCVGHRLRLGSRTALRVHGRQVTLLRLRRGSESDERWTCMDSICYHAGGPLLQGEIRQVAGRTCVSCPWHNYLVDVFSGEGLYMDLSRQYCSKGARQRVHQVDVRGDGHVFVKLMLHGGMASDDYAYKGRNYIQGAEVPTRSFPDW